MKNLDVLSKAIADEKATQATPAPAPVDLSKLSTDDVEKIAARVVEMLSERTPDAPPAQVKTETTESETAESDEGDAPEPETEVD